MTSSREGELPSPDILAGLVDLSNLAYTQPPGVDDLITSVLQLLGETLQVGQTHFTHVAGDTLYYVRVHDRLGMSVHEGDAIPLVESYCQAMLQDAVPSLVVEDASLDTRFNTLLPTRDAGIRAYSGVPLYHVDGRLYGTLCTIHPERRAIDPEEPRLLALAARIIMHAVDAEALHRAELVRTECLLACIEDRWQYVVDSAPDAIVTTDEDGKIQSWNNAARAMFLYDEAEILGQRFTTLLPGSYRQKLHEDLQRVSCAGESISSGHTTEVHGSRRDGTQFPLELSIGTWTSGGKRFFSGIMRDITEDRAVRQIG